jgi:hypothetical protein
MLQLEISLLLMVASLCLFCRALWRRWRFRGLTGPDVKRLESRELWLGLIILAIVMVAISMKLLALPP